MKNFSYLAIKTINCYKKLKIGKISLKENNLINKMKFNIIKDCCNKNKMKIRI